MKKFIFDVDGTLTPSRKQMDVGFSAEFLIFCCKFDTYLVTGSDRDKTIEQVGLDIYNRCKRVFNCSGSDIYDGKNSVYRSNWKPSDELISFLNDELDFSDFPIRTGNHIEHRPGGINFSILGRGEGQTGLDISDSDKSQIIKFFNFDDEVHFFGDMMEEGQNDYPLARAVKERLGFTYHVKSWEDTRTYVNRFSSTFATGLKYN